MVSLKVSHTRYQVLFYFWSVETVLKLCKIPKDYEQDCLKIFILLLPTLKIILISEQIAILTQIRMIYQKSRHQQKMIALLS